MLTVQYFSNFVVENIFSTRVTYNMNRLIAKILIALALAAGGSMSLMAQVERDATIQQLNAENASLRVVRGHIELTAQQGHTYTFQIYSITGQLVKSVTVTSSTEVISLPQGYYIVKCSEWSKKAVVR